MQEHDLKKELAARCGESFEEEFAFFKRQLDKAFKVFINITNCENLIESDNY